MPEGPEIRRAADRLAGVLVDTPICRVELNHPALTPHHNQIEGATITSIRSRSKALLTSFSTGITIYSHNQLYGVWQVRRAGSADRSNRQMRLAFHTDRHVARLYSATDISVWDTDEVEQHPYIAGLGPDVLDESLTPAALAARLADDRFRRRSLAALFLDQKFLAGIGNYLRTEILFASNLHPALTPAKLENKQLDRLAREAIRISRRSYRTGGITNPPKWYRPQKDRGSGYEGYRFMAFAREGEGCHACGENILREERAARRIYWCPNCQPRSV